MYHWLFMLNTIMGRKQKYPVGSTVGPDYHILIDRWDEFSPSGRRSAYGTFSCTFCDNTFDTKIQSIVSGTTASCGCLKPGVTHGLSRTIFYSAWYGMMTRCYSPTATQFDNYGGRGIQVCDEWVDIRAFKRDMLSLLAKQGLILEDWGKGANRWTLDRIDNDLDYSLSNVRFATPLEQANNRRRG